MKRISSGMLALATCLLSFVLTAQLALASTEGFLSHDKTRSPIEAVKQTLQEPSHVQEHFFASVYASTGHNRDAFLSLMSQGRYKVVYSEPHLLLTARIVDKEIQWWREVTSSEVVVWMPNINNVLVPVFLPACGNPIKIKVVTRVKESTCEFCGCVPTGPPQRWQEYGDESYYYQFGNVTVEERTGGSDVNIFYPMKCYNPTKKGGAPK